MKALTLIQPWAALIAIGAKVHETRGARFSHRGLLAIHAGLKVDAENAPEPLTSILLGRDWPAKVPRGAIVAIGYLSQVFTTEEARTFVTAPDLLAGDYSDGRFALQIQHVRPLFEPIPARGKQGLWDWDAPADLDRLEKPIVNHVRLCHDHGWTGASACR